MAVNLDLLHGTYNRGNAMLRAGRFEEAAALYRSALAMKPDFPEALCNLGTALKDLGRVAEAVASYRHAIALRPDFAEAHNSLGTVLYDDDHLFPAKEHFEIALALRPDLVDAHINMALVHKTMGDHDKAIACLDRALALDPNRSDARENRAYALMAAGNLRAAWPDYEWRWHNPSTRRPFTQPWWDGTPLDGKELLVWGEQGIGDEFMGVGMLPDVMRCGGRCVLECEPRLVDLFARSFPNVTVVPRQTPPHPRTLKADRQIALFSLARYFRNEASDFPRGRPHLVPDPARVEHWRSWLGGLGPGKTVGLVWKTRLSLWQHRRSFPSLDQLNAILETPGVVFVNLQYDDYAEDIEAMRRQTGVTIHCPEGIDLTNDLDDVAALTFALDGVVGNMTSVVPLAGAVGRPSWMLVHPSFGEKTYCHFDHLPWCPTTRIRRLSYDEDWSGPLNRIAADLRQWAETEG